MESSLEKAGRIPSGLWKWNLCVWKGEEARASVPPLPGSRHRSRRGTEGL